MEKLSSRSVAMILVLIILSAAVYTSDTSLASVCKKTRKRETEKPTVILVHGFMSGGWVWYKVRPILESFGYNVISPDLKASGIDLTDVSKVESFEDYNEPLDRLMASLPNNKKVVLVGHSVGGVSVTKILHDYPEKVGVAIYVCAAMLKHGFVTCEDLQNGVPYFSKTNCSASCPTYPKPTCFEKVIPPNNDRIHPVGRTQDTILGLSLARPGPYRAVLSANFTSRVSTAIEKVPRVYVKTLNDRTLIPEQQTAMINSWPPCEVHQISNDHDAPFARPSFLASLIIDATAYVSGD